MKFSCSSNDVLSPDSSIMHCTIGSDLARRFNPSTSLGKSCAFFGSTATLTTGETENFITFRLCASLNVVMVPVLTKNWSTPTSPQMLPHGTSSIASMYRPIIRIVLWIAFSFKSYFFARNVIRAHNSGLQACGNLTRKDTAKGVETSFVRCGYHFRNVHHKRAVRVTIFHRNCSGIIIRPLVQHVCPILLGSHW